MTSKSIDDEEKKLENELFDQFKDINPNDLIRGKTPDDINERCFKLVQIYMTNNDQWKRLCKTTNDLNVRRITGGMTNQLYYVGLKNGINEIDNDAITIKFYQSKHFKKDIINGDTDDERLNDTIISIIISEQGIGPKVFGILSDGIIQSYHEHEQFRPKHQHNDRLLKKLAYLLAKLNNLDIPIAKDKFYLIDILTSYIHEGYRHHDVLSLAKEFNLRYLLENDFLAEMDWFDSFIRYYLDQCPMVFNHNDFRGNNIMVLKDSDEILLCDFEYSSYGFRGYDLASFLMEWDRNFLNFEDTSLPSDDVVEKFIQFYIEGWEQIDPGYSTREENSCQKIMNETKIGYLFVLIHIMGVTLHQKEEIIASLQFDPKKISIGVNFMFKRYLDFKNLLIEEKIIDY
nr:probable ethanolamine kinase [Dermatophagoides farinae]